MKKIFVTVAVIMMVAAAFATTNPANGKSYAFNSVDDEVAFEVERVSTEVNLDVLVKDLSQYDHIIIERSPDGGAYFGQCKYITYNDEKTDNGYMLKTDKYPFPAVKDSYYRIKTVTKDGVTRAYPAVALKAVSK